MFNLFKNSKYNAKLMAFNYIKKYLTFYNISFWSFSELHRMVIKECIIHNGSGQKVMQWAKYNGSGQTRHTLGLGMQQNHQDDVKIKLFGKILHKSMTVHPCNLISVR